MAEGDGSERNGEALRSARRYLQIVVVAVAAGIAVAILVWIVYIVGFIAGLWGDFGR